MKTTVSIIIVHYHVKEELFTCIQSIINSKPKSSYEILVVDNDEKKTIKKNLLQKFPKVIYLPNVNKGFGQGNNVGARNAKGEYLFFLNPDTIVFKNTLDTLIEFLKKNKKAGVVAPFLLHENKMPFEQGTKILTPIRAIFALSFINKLFPNNSIAKNYFIQWDKISLKDVDVVPGTALMLSKKLYDELHGFDESFFLYFEEFDLCKRVKEKGYKLFIEPKAKIIHLWERSTKKRNDIDKIFRESRYYYFKKHFGLIAAVSTEAVLRIGKFTVLITAILLLATFVRFYQLPTLMTFIGDQAWFYISARDMLLTGHIPLVGITSSHIWLHQGPLWTYMLAGALWAGNFNPVAGAYLTAAIGIFTVWLIYKVGTEVFTARVGIVASLLYATSPLIISSDQMAYHTAPISTLVLLLFYVLYKWINGYRFGFPLIILLLTTLYNFEIATFMFTPLIGIVVVYGIIKKTEWMKTILDKKIIFLSFLALLIPMIPMIFYDVHHGYPQTLKFALWIGYKVATVFGFPSIHPEIPNETFANMIPFATGELQSFIFLKSAVVAWVIFVVSIINLIILNRKIFNKSHLLNSYSLLFLFFFIPAVIYIAEKTNSGAYWPVFSPTFAFMLALVFNSLMDIPKWYFLSLFLLLLFVGTNIYALEESNYKAIQKGLTFTQYVDAAKTIIKESRGKEYNIVGRGPGSQYASFTNGDVYLTWWLGHGPSSKKQPLRFIVGETPYGITVKREMIK